MENKILLEDVVIQNKEIDATDLNGEKVMMNLDKGQYFMLNEVASRIWDITDEPTKVSEIISTLLEEYEIDNETCEKTVIEFLSKLNNVDLIVKK
ncbi:lasso peptide biosynthesis PqqD family chaperone [Clostridium tarantellae]|uniref:Lasso peptide biosynthesis PqqD family chaperone n=2 Tax=Clostridium tarantellae TaxID=39493 RepID=A0A6I1MLE1_9CLOT|nr:lasso peptide biosynthesis PqqD family chaperone [Clostridium tarantellae]